MIFAGLRISGQLDEFCCLKRERREEQRGVGHCLGEIGEGKGRERRGEEEEIGRRIWGNHQVRFWKTSSPF